LDNKLLASLQRDDFELLAPVLRTLSLAQGIVLAEPGDEFDHVYFPHSGMLSLLAVMKDGKAIETATVGEREACWRYGRARTVQIHGAGRRSAPD
jgi:hypothetical protein